MPGGDKSVGAGTGPDILLGGAASRRPSPVVLVVDDDPASLRMLCDALEAGGYTVLIATSGEAALQRLAHAAPDAILLDGVMPGLSGFETCRRIKADPRSAHIPVLFMTGLGETTDVVQGFESGGVDYVVKPIRIAEVLARLQTHTRNARMAQFAHAAVDVAGMGVLFVDLDGSVVWLSPQATQWLQQAGGVSQLPPAWQAARQAGASLQLPWDERHVMHIRSIGAPSAGELMLLLRLEAQNAETGSRLRDAALTARETEVLSWVAKGKTNRDIAEILQLSPRTVNKHLEHVFEKLGVETRAAAAALASRELA
ncbi:DNA-binding response regulator [Corticibacter populi]|uniref:DNA-binding response regulator n=2 Tax=Corticibacter populi TaxID=1550736 RepID=A0A3M6R0N1_9BURK|nr:DNA-binding response regulator [Corticibacter populi]